MKSAMRYLFAALLATTSCNVDETGGESTDDVEFDEHLGVVEQPFTSWITGTSLVTSVPQIITFGGSGTGSCFLQILAGNLDNSGDSIGESSANTMTYTSGGYELWVSPTRNRTLGAAVGCVTPNTGLTPYRQYFTGQSPIFLGSSLPNRQCFLTVVRNSAVGNGNGFASTGDLIQAYQDGIGDWYLGGLGNAGGSARCITMSSVHGVVSLFGPATNVDLGLTSPGKMCFLRGVGGVFRGGGAAAGVSLDGQGHWRLNVTAGNVATVVCGT